MWRWKVMPYVGLMAVLAVTSLAPLAFVQLNEPEARWNLWKLLAKSGSLCGTLLMAWQLLLGYRQLAARWVNGDVLWTVAAHKRLGVVIGLLVLLHPIFLTPFYREKLNVGLWSGDWPGPLGAYVPVGLGALLVLAVIVLSSVLVRRHMGGVGWYATHLSSYVLLPAAMIHGYFIGETLTQTPLRIIWLGLFAVVGLLYALRMCGSLGLLSAVYEVAATAHAAADVTEISLRPLRRPLRPAAAQFAYFRRGRWGRTRPFTISGYDPMTGHLKITVKALGETTRALQHVQPGERFLVDGPYGVFGREAFIVDRPIVMLAGGIGITPFRRMIRELEKQRGREVYLFYGNQYEQDIAHREEIEAAEHVDLVHVLSGVEEHERFATGYITVPLLRRHLRDDLAAYEYFLCGPPAMIHKLEPDLRQAGVPRSHIHHELFGY